MNEATFRAIVEGVSEETGRVLIQIIPDRHLRNFERGHTTVGAPGQHPVVTLWVNPTGVRAWLLAMLGMTDPEFTSAGGQSAGRGVAVVVRMNSEGRLELVRIIARS